MLCAVLIGELDVHFNSVTGCGTDQLLFEAGDEGVGAEHEGVILSGTTFECFAVNFAEEVDHNLIAIFGFTVFGVKVLCGLRKVVERVLDVSIRRLHDQFLDRNG